jgi:8-oxo-dGTP pyrophosphatase MutT (NUDIX family)
LQLEDDVRRNELMARGTFCKQAYDGAGWRVSAVAVMRWNGQYLTGVHNDRGSVEWPAGGVDIGETIVNAALREVFEETGWCVQLANWQVHANHSFLKRQYIVYGVVRSAHRVTNGDGEMYDAIWSERTAIWDGVDPDVLDAVEGNATIDIAETLMNIREDIQQLVREVTTNSVYLRLIGSITSLILLPVAKALYDLFAGMRHLRARVRRLHSETARTDHPQSG